MPLLGKPVVSLKLYLALEAAILALLVSCGVSDQALVVSKDSQRWVTA